MGCSLNSVICSGGKGEMSDLKRWSLQNFHQRNRKVAKLVEIKDVSDVGNYILAARSKGKGPVGIDATAQGLIDLSNCAKNSLMIQSEKEEWLFSKISKFPIDE
jgi:hypothetical protein